MPAFSLKGVNKVYEGVAPTVSLKDIDLQIKSGEFLSVLCPSGCGKSTLLEILAGLQTPTSGTIEYNGESLVGTDRKRGVVFQDPSLFPWRTISQNIEFGLEIQGVSRQERRDIVSKYIDMVGLNGFEHKYPHHLSGGMKQRAGLARALANNPDVLLMDEPFGAVDHLTRLQLQDDLLEICRQEQKTVVFVTHDVSEAVYLGDRVVLLSPRPGRIHEIFKVPSVHPRKREDVALHQLQNEIYASIYDVKTQADLEFII